MPSRVLRLVMDTDNGSYSPSMWSDSIVACFCFRLGERIYTMAGKISPEGAMLEPY
jgi:hypothetical protein